MGLTVLLPKDGPDHVRVTLRFAKYEPDGVAGESGRRTERVWRRHAQTPAPFEVSFEELRGDGKMVPDHSGVWAVGELELDVVAQRGAGRCVVPDAKSQRLTDAHRAQAPSLREASVDRRRWKTLAPSSTGHLGASRASFIGWGFYVLLAGVGCASAPERGRDPRAALCSFDGYLAQLCRENDGRDRDGDGLPDALETLLGTAPDRADSDQDGRLDAEDPCPLLEGGEPRGVEAEIRQAAVSHLLREHERVIVAIPDGEDPTCYRDVPGPQLHGRDVPWEYASLRFFRVSADAGSGAAEEPSAVVEVRFSGVSSGCVWRMTLVRRRGRWRVLDAIPTLCA